jgi:hypothetical protein
MDANASLRNTNTGLTETVAKGKQLVIATSTTAMMWRPFILAGAWF